MTRLTTYHGTTDLDKVFHSSITHHTSLVIPNCDEARCVFSDASLCGIGGVLCVSRFQCWVPCSFFSRQLLPREQKFAATELEALALLETVEHFKLYLAGRDFAAYTDHQALLGILEGVPSSAKLTRWKHKLETQTGGLLHLYCLHQGRAESSGRCTVQARMDTAIASAAATSAATHQQLHQHISLQKQPIQNYSPTPVSSDQAQASEEGGGVVDPPTKHTHSAGHCYN